MAARVWFPGHIPFLLPAGAICPEQRAINTRARQFPYRCLAEVVDENIFSADYAVSSRAHAHRVIVVFEHPDFKSFIQRSDLLIDITSHCDAEHRQSSDIE